MKVNIQTKGVIITSKQKAIIEKKINKLRKYLGNNEAATVDVVLCDETGPEKGGADQIVQLNVNVGKEKIFVEEADNRFMRAFAYAFERLDRNLKRRHQKNVDRHQKVGEGRFEKVYGFLRRKGKRK